MPRSDEACGIREAREAAGSGAGHTGLVRCGRSHRLEIIPRHGGRLRRGRHPRRGSQGPAGGRQLSPPNKLVTEPSLNTSLMARAISGAMESTVSLSNRRSGGIGSVLVITTSLIREFLRLSTAGPDSTPWVATTITLAATWS